MTESEGCRFPNKQAHSTYAAAVTARKVLRRKKDANDDVVVYLCGNHWHVGHDPKVFTERIRRSIRKTPRRSRQHR